MEIRSRARAVAMTAAAALVASLMLFAAPAASMADDAPPPADTTTTDTGTPGAGTPSDEPGTGTTTEPPATDLDPAPTTEPEPTTPPAPKTLTAATPKIGGKVAVGSKISVSPGTWTPGVSFSYRWYANGKAISKASGKTLKLTSALKNKRISVKVTGKKSGFPTVAKTSAKTGKVLVAKTPKIVGVMKAGKTLTVKKGTWTKGTKFAYQWYADGKAVPGTKGKKSKLKLTGSLAAQSITVTVTGRKAGYATVPKTSKALKSSSRWIEIDLSSQTMILHEKGKVVGTYKVSTGTRSHPTKTGTFTIRAKLRIQNMGNPNLNRPPYYYTKNVPWVMYFNGDQALHGAYWHNNFGRVMSHGCVNLPVKVAKKVYAWAKKGTTVVVHK